MLFHTPTFLIFLAIFLVGMVFFKGKFRSPYVCVASYIFYGWWYLPYVFVLGGLTLFAYIVIRHQIWRWAGIFPLIFLALLPLAIFKYTGFIIETTVTQLGSTNIWRPDWLLPLGISFITFTVIAAIIEARRGDPEVPKQFWSLALFISFFPQLIAGPILRGKELAPQLDKIFFDRSAIKTALFLFTLGAVKKVGIADQIAPIVDTFYQNQTEYNLATSLLAGYGFAIQIYCDFSGYTDMALGLALLLGVQLPPNFEKPYLASSVREFWRRWHMTLSRWLRDFLYIPLGGNQHGFPRTILALFFTMLLGGIWHGSAWNFIIWGAIHGVFLIIERSIEKAGISFDSVPTFLKIFMTFNITTFAWVFFRAKGLDQALDIFQGILVTPDYSSLIRYPFILFSMALVLISHRWDSKEDIVRLAKYIPNAVFYPATLMIYIILAALLVGNPSTFIYFDF